ncbi:hypothetical protein F8388_018355 [Cannabis sativa]|uniref:Reverse transcriptase zinc-binding domain-containing protein n=1 Tax=Cannabis sativa TaxID=3483 RepID=A0A7J6HF33_CANSA|nr:hypothetical protein F8388_018355 [Cannabis sativa]
MNPFIESVHPGLVGKAVDSLTKVDLVEWDMEVIADVLNARDQALVWKIPLSSHVSTDLWYWLHDTSGVFTLQLPPKVLNFLWRASTNNLPTRFHLSTKHIPIAATCAFCLAAPETTLHVLVRCSFAQSCWSKVPIPVVAPDAMLFSSWFEAGLTSWNTAEALEAGF